MPINLWPPPFIWRIFLEFYQLHFWCRWKWKHYFYHFASERRATSRKKSHGRAQTPKNVVNKTLNGIKEGANTQKEMQRAPWKTMYCFEKRLRAQTYASQTPTMYIWRYLLKYQNTFAATIPTNNFSQQLIFNSNGKLASYTNKKQFMREEQLSDKSTLCTAP